MRQLDDQTLNIIDTVTAIRKRPGMYVGTLDRNGVHHMLYWALDDILDNARAGRGRFVKVILSHDGWCTIEDDGDTMAPDDRDPGGVTDRLDRLVSEMRVGGPRGTAAQVQTRDYLPVLRALSEEFVVTARVGAETYTRTYERGEPVTEWGTTEIKSLLDPNVVVCFRPDPEIFSEIEAGEREVRTRLLYMAATYPELLTDLCIEKAVGDAKYEHIRMPEGMADMARVLMKDAGEDVPHPKEPFRLRVDQGGLAFDVALQWHTGKEMGDGETSFSWANTVRTKSGSHALGVREAVDAAGLGDVPHVACVSVFVPQPRFATPTKDELRNPEIRRLVRDHLTVALRRLVEDDGFAFEIEDVRETLARWEREDEKERSWKKVELDL
jgi:DNA gyrase/topoisomerase IV subunit B